MNLFTKQIQTQTQKINLWLPTRKEGDKLGVWDQDINAIMYKIDKQQGPTVQHMELYSVSSNNL